MNDTDGTVPVVSHWKNAYFCVNNLFEQNGSFERLF